MTKLKKHQIIKQYLVQYKQDGGKMGTANYKEDQRYSDDKQN